MTFFVRLNIEYEVFSKMWRLSIKACQKMCLYTNWLAILKRKVN